VSLSGDQDMGAVIAGRVYSGVVVTPVSAPLSNGSVSAAPAPSALSAPSAVLSAPAVVLNSSTSAANPALASTPVAPSSNSMHPGLQQRASVSAGPQGMVSALPGQYNSPSHPQLSFQQQQQQQQQQQMQHRGSNAQRGMGQHQFFQQQQQQMFMHQPAQPMIVMGPNGIPFVVPSPMGLQQNMHMGMMAPMMAGSLPAYGMNHMHGPGMGMGGPMQPMPIQASLAPTLSGMQSAQLSQHAAPFNPPVAAVGAGAVQGSALPAPAFGVANPAALYVTSR
jgi:hypothetical protein